MRGWKRQPNRKKVAELTYVIGIQNRKNKNKRKNRGLERERKRRRIRKITSRDGMMKERLKNGDFTCWFQGKEGRNGETGREMMMMW